MGKSDPDRRRYEAGIFRHLLQTYPGMQRNKAHLVVSTAKIYDTKIGDDVAKIDIIHGIAPWEPFRVVTDSADQVALTVDKNPFAVGGNQKGICMAD